MDNLKQELEMFFYRIIDFFKTNRGRAVIVIWTIIWVFYLNTKMWIWIVGNEYVIKHGIEGILAWFIFIILTAVSLFALVLIIVILHTIGDFLYKFIKYGKL